MDLTSGGLERYLGSRPWVAFVAQVLMWSILTAGINASLGRPFEGTDLAFVFLVSAAGTYGFHVRYKQADTAETDS